MGGTGDYSFVGVNFGLEYLNCLHQWVEQKKAATVADEDPISSLMKYGLAAKSVISASRKFSGQRYALDNQCRIVRMMLIFHYGCKCGYRHSRLMPADFKLLVWDSKKSTPAGK